MPQTFKKALALTTIFVVVLFSLGLGCKKQTTTTSKKTTLTIWRQFDDPEDFQPIINRFEQENPNVKINYVKKDSTDYELQSLNALASGEGPDIWSVPNDWMYRHYDKLVAMPDGFLKTDRKDKRSNPEIYKELYPEVATKDNVINGKVYGFPLSIDTLAILYNTNLIYQLASNNRELVEKIKKLISTTPLNWNEFIEIIQGITQKDTQGNIKIAGVALGTVANNPQVTDILYALMLQNNTIPVSSDLQTAQFNLPTKKDTGELTYPAVNALDFFLSFSDPKSSNYTWNDSMPNYLDAFIHERVVMILDYNYQIKNIKQKVPTMSIMASDLPQKAEAEKPINFASYQVETVTKNSKNPELAWKFVKYYATGYNLYQYQQATSRPPALVSQFAPNTTLPFNSQPLTATSWFKGPEPQQVDKLFTQAIQQGVERQVSTKEILDGTAAQVTKLLRSKN